MSSENTQPIQFDPALQELMLRETGALPGQIPFEDIPADEVPVVAKLADPSVPVESLNVVAYFGRVITGRIPLRRLVQVRQHENVESLKASKDYAPSLAFSVPEIRASAEVLRAEVAAEGFSGRGVVIGVADWGCDFGHANFLDTDGNSRLLYLWDQRGGNQPSSPAPFGYGREFQRDQINEALHSDDPYAALSYDPVDADPDGTGAHGTHVLDIAAGNGAADGASPGVAPEADIIFVHLKGTDTRPQDTLGDSVRLLEAVRYILDRAGDRPVAINLSLGWTGGPHDGRTLVEQGLDALLEQRPGCVICMSTGNYFHANLHSSGKLKTGEQASLRWEVTPRNDEIAEMEVWYPGEDVFGVELFDPHGRLVASAASGESIVARNNDRIIASVYHRRGDPNNGDNQIDIFLWPDAPVGTWETRLTGHDVQNGSYHAWLERDDPQLQSRFTPDCAVQTCTTNTICNGYHTISVGGYDAREVSHPLIPPSSSGPTADNRSKPDISAPGAGIRAARSSSPSDDGREMDQLTVKTGASMAAPHVTGLCALMFEAAGNHRLTAVQTRQILIDTARTSPPFDETDRLRYGAGRVDAVAALKAVRALVQSSVPATEVADEAVTPVEAITELEPVLLGAIEERNWHYMPAESPKALSEARFAPTPVVQSHPSPRPRRSNEEAGTGVLEWLLGSTNVARESEESQVWDWLSGRESVRSSQPDHRLGAGEQAQLIEALQNLRSVLEEEIAATGEQAVLFYQEVLDAIATATDRRTLAILKKLLPVCEAVDRQDKAAIPKLLDEFIESIKVVVSRPTDTLSAQLTLALASRLYMMRLDTESKSLRKVAATFYADETPGVRTPMDKEAFITREFEAIFWKEMVKQAGGYTLADVQSASKYLDHHLLRLFADIRDVFAAYNPEHIRQEAAASFGNTSYQPNAFAVLNEQLNLLFVHIQRHLQFMLDTAVADLETSRGSALLNQLQDILQTKMFKAIFPEKKELWVGGVKVKITRSEFTKKGGLHLDFFLDGKAARERSVAITFYNADGDTGIEKEMSYERVNQIRVKQIKFLRFLYGIPEKASQNGVLTADALQNHRLIDKMAGRKFRLHNNDDWREFLQLKFSDIRGQKGLLGNEALLRIMGLLEAYLNAFTIHTPYNVYDSGPDNYLTKTFPRALTGQLIHDCGVYALRSVYVLSLVRRDADLLFNFVFLPAHVGLIVHQVSRVDAGKKQHAPVFVQHNGQVFYVGNLIELARIRQRWSEWKEPVRAGAPPKPLPVGVLSDDLQFLGELAGSAFIAGPVDMPFRLKDVPDDPKWTPTEQKSKLWTFYKDEALIEIFGEATHDDKTEVYQVHLLYLGLIQNFRNLFNDQVLTFWNAHAPGYWRDVLTYVKNEMRQGKATAFEAVALLNGYRSRLTKSFAPVDKALADLEQKKKDLSALVQRYPKLKKAGIRFTFGLRAAVIRPARGFDLFEEQQKHLTKVNETVAGWEKQHENIAITPALDDLTPLFATPRGFLEPID